MGNIIFIGGIFTPSSESKILSQSKGCIQFAADTLQKCYLEGLSALGCDFELFNMPYIGNYPKLSTLFRFNVHDEDLTIANRKIHCHNIKFNNLALYKNWSRYVNLKKALKTLCKRSKGERIVLIIYAAHTPFMKAANEIRREFDNIRTVLIVPDLPEFMGQSNSFMLRTVHSYNEKLAKELYNGFDGYVFLSKHMADRIPVKNNNFEVIEGIYSDNNIPVGSNGLDIGSLAVTYTGTLAQRYGIMNLVNAFKKVEKDEARLVIIGDGNTRELIEKAAQSDSRILYLGQMPHDKVLEIQRESAVLVNPRTSEGEFTKYSFPSKTMEYLASGVPTIINPLPGIPAEYLKYSFQPKDESVDSLANCINVILNLSKEQRKHFGNEARAFILSEKTPVPQCRKLMNLINRI